MTKNIDKIVTNAKGKIDPQALTNSGTSGLLRLRTGYPTKPIIEYLQDGEQLHYLMENYTDGVKINGGTTSLSDDQRNFICITDSGVLIIIGDSKNDKRFGYDHNHIIGSEFKSGIISSDKLILNSYNQDGGEDTVIFPIRGGSDGKAASQYINSVCKGVAPKTGNSRNERIATVNDRGAKASQTTSSSTNQKEKEERISTDQNKESNSNKENIQEKIQSLRSDLYNIDSLLTEAEYKQSEQRLDEVKSEISSLKRQVSQGNYDDLGTDLQRLEAKCDNRLSKSHVLSQLREMDPYKFEELVAKIWRKKGWDAEVTSGSTDRGVDVVATKEDAFEKRRHLIQVKRHGENTTVGSEDIQRYASLYQRDEQVDNVFVVTSNRFTEEAKAVAKRRDVSTINGDELYEMLTKT